MVTAVKATQTLAKEAREDIGRKNQDAKAAKEAAKAAAKPAAKKKAK